jgi:very-short-patch-repair endonuclease
VRGNSRHLSSKMKRKNVEICRKLRKNQTEAERKLWRILRNRRLHGVKFRRQFPVDRYILDFYSPEVRLGIEADGSQHYEEKGKRRDELRTKKLSQVGVQILRFNDREILKNIEGVYQIIQEAIERVRTAPSP